VVPKKSELVMEFSFDIRELKRIWMDLEKQMFDFNEIIPYGRNPHDVYSPKLVNMMLITGPQIEAMAKLIVKKLKLKPKGKGVPRYLKEINKNAVLSVQRIVSITSGLLFTPFPAEYAWWKSYNLTKHELLEEIFKIRYQKVIESLAALAILHRIYDVMEENPKHGKEVLDRKNWLSPTIPVFDENDEIVTKEVEWSNTWTSQLFKITTYYHYVQKPKK